MIIIKYDYDIMGVFQNRNQRINIAESGGTTIGEYEFTKEHRWGDDVQKWEEHAKMVQDGKTSAYDCLTYIDAPTS